MCILVFSVARPLNYHSSQQPGRLGSRSEINIYHGTRWKECLYERRGKSQNNPSIQWWISDFSLPFSWVMIKCSKCVWFRILWQLLREGLFGDCHNRWYDKTLSFITTKNGTITYNCDVSIEHPTKNIVATQMYTNVYELFTICLSYVIEICIRIPSSLRSPRLTRESIGQGTILLLLKANQIMNNHISFTFPLAAVFVATFRS